MVPLSLSLTSPGRPTYISTSVLDEMEKFLYNLAWFVYKLNYPYIEEYTTTK